LPPFSRRGIWVRSRLAGGPHRQATTAAQPGAAARRARARGRGARGARVGRSGRGPREGSGMDGEFGILFFLSIFLIFLTLFYYFLIRFICEKKVPKK
jgi:hypothetical protein